MSDDIVLDVRELPPRERHPRIFEAWESLKVGGALRLVNDHDPKPLYYEFSAERAGEFDWSYVERGPERWEVEIRRVSEPRISLDKTVKEVAESHPGAQAVLMAHGLDLCCGGAHPVRMAAQAHGVDPQALLAELKEASGDGTGVEGGARPSPSGVGRCVPGGEAPKIHTLDVRGMEPPQPMVSILTKLTELGPEDVLEVTHFREPFPLYPRLEEAGFAHEIVKLEEGLYRLTIRRRKG